MGHVSRIMPLGVTRVLERRGVPTAGLFDGLGTTALQLREQRAGMAWADWIRFTGRVIDRCGGIEATALIASDLDTVTPFCDWAKAGLFTPSEQARFYGLLSPRLFEGIDLRFDEHRGGERVTIRTPTELPANDWLLVGAHALRIAAEASGAQADDVRIDDVGPHHIVLTLRRHSRAAQPGKPNLTQVLRAATAVGARLARSGLAEALRLANDVADGVRVVDLAGDELARSGTIGVVRGRAAVHRDGQVVGTVEVDLADPTLSTALAEALTPWVAASWGHIDGGRLDDGVLARAGALIAVKQGGQVEWANAAGWAWIAEHQNGLQRVGLAARQPGDAELARLPVGDLVMLSPSDPESEHVARLDHCTSAWGLTPRQRDVLGLLVRGLSNKEMANVFGGSEATVEVHVTQLFRKSGAEGRVALASRFWRPVGGG